MTYKKNDYVKILHTDYPDHHKVGEIRRVLAVEEGYITLESGKDSFSGGMTYYHDEVEPAVIATVVEADSESTFDQTLPTKISFRFMLGKEKDEEFHSEAIAESVTPEDALTIITIMLKGR